MVQGPSLDAIEAIRNPQSLESQITHLKQLKNDIVGHDQRKELVVQQGIIEPLINILTTSSKATGKRRIAETNGASTQGVKHPWTQEEEARHQAILILASLASGGPAFVPPLTAVETPRHLIEALETESSTKLSTAILQALRSLAASASICTDSRERLSLGIVSSLTAPLNAIAEEAVGRPAASSQRLRLIVDIVAFSAYDEESRAALAASGAIQTLSYLLVSYSIAYKHLSYRGQSTKYRQGPMTKVVPNILSAISKIVTGSLYRTQLFIHSPDVREMMSNSVPVNPDSRFSFGSRTGFQNPMEGQLPQLHVPTTKSVSFNPISTAFPALASMQPGADRKADERALQLGSDLEHSNAVIMWLLFFARSMKGKDRLAALELLARVNNSLESDAKNASPRSDQAQRAKEREFNISMLAVPLAIQFVQTASDGKDSEPGLNQEDCEYIKEQACEILSLLIKSNKDLQAAAVEAGAVKRVCPALKKTFDSVPIAKPMWPSKPNDGDAQKDMPPSCKMGSRGLPPEIQHLMQRRKSALQALAAIADSQDGHRKAIIDSGVSSCIIDSLKPFPPDYFNSPATNRDKVTLKDGNTIPVILAACDAARAMSRSVSLLRTSLIDAGIAKPIFALLKHQDLEVQIAATNVCCNLVLDFSPMREDLMAAGAMKILAEHARQSEMRLRLASLWALKHLVLSAPKNVKIQCLEELGPGWLVGAIEGDTKDVVSLPSTGGVSVGGLSTPNAAGEQVDLLNPASLDVDDPLEAMELEQDEDGEVMYDEASSTHYQASQLRSTLNPSSGCGNSHSASLTNPPFNASRYLSAIREMESNPTLLAKRDDINVQEQALDFIRNMLNGEDCAVMFEHLIEQVGVDKIFNLLNDKLAPVAETSLKSGRTHATYQPSELILATVHVLCHIANGSPKHKQLLIAQKQLLQNWLPHFKHADRRIRCICVWAVNNLTWIEEENDRSDALKRCQALQQCGIVNAVRELLTDPDLDVRERVRTAMRQIEIL